MPNPNFENINAATGFSSEQRHAMAQPTAETSAGLREHDPVALGIEKKNKEAVRRTAGQVALRPDVVRDPMDAVIDNLRQPQHLAGYQEAEGFNQEADELLGGERTLGDVMDDARSGYYPESGTWQWEGQELDMPPARPELPPHSQN